MTMQTLNVCGQHSRYPIYIGCGLLKREPSLLLRHIIGSRVVIVTNEVVGPLYLNVLKGVLAPHEVSEVILPDGERWKTMETLAQLFDYLLKNKHDKTTTLIALGGGVVGDLVGFAAACYRRGIPFIQIPTSLLAQVDASVGGKTGVNHVLGKNMIGAFYQPSCVLVDISLLSTLPNREYAAGMAEVIKYGLIMDDVFYQWIETHISDLMHKNLKLLEHVVYQSCFHKARIVSEDECEKGPRAILNFGHTFGHGIETVQQYTGLLHGEAVAIGMLIAMHISCRMGLLPHAEEQRLRKLLRCACLPIKLPDDVDHNALLQVMKQDKKVQLGRLHLVLLEKVGKAYTTSDFDVRVLQETLNAF